MKVYSELFLSSYLYTIFHQRIFGSVILGTDATNLSKANWLQEQLHVQITPLFLCIISSYHPQLHTGAHPALQALCWSPNTNSLLAPGTLGPVSLVSASQGSTWAFIWGWGRESICSRVYSEIKVCVGGVKWLLLAACHRDPMFSMFIMSLHTSSLGLL